MRQKLAALIGESTDGPAVDLLARVNAAEDYILNGLDEGKVSELHELQESTEQALNEYAVPPGEAELLSMAEIVETYDRTLND